MRFVVYREGWNGLNQPRGPCPLSMKVALVEAGTAEEAVGVAHGTVACYPGQRLHARPLAEVEAEERLEPIPERAEVLW